MYKGKIDDLSDLDVPLLNAISQWDRTGRSVHRIDIFDQFGIDPSPVLSPDESEFSTLSRELGKIYHLVKYANLGIGAEDLIAKDPESFARLVNSFSHTVKRLFSFYQPALVEEISLSSTRKEVESHEINGALTYSLLAMQRASRDIVNDLVNLYEKRGLGDLVGHMKPGLFLPNVNELKKEYRRLVGANKSARNSSGHIRVAGRSKLSEYDLPLIRKFDNELYGLALEVLSDQVKTSRHKTYWGYDTDNSSRRELVFNQTFGHLERSFTSLIDYYASSKGEKPLISLQNIPENRNRLDLMKLIEGITSFEGTYNCERLEHNPEIEKTYQVVQNRVMAYLNKRLSSDSISSAQQG
ncbi:hypothetical protein HOG47_00160 [archaeon]|nr:hypothetical protein [archaeon]